MAFGQKLSHFKQLGEKMTWYPKDMVLQIKNPVHLQTKNEYWMQYFDSVGIHFLFFSFAIVSACAPALDVIIP